MDKKRRRISDVPSETTMRITTILLKHGQGNLADCWELSSSEVSRKLKGDTGISIAQFADALDSVGAVIVTSDEFICMPIEEVEALRILASKGLKCK